MNVRLVLALFLSAVWLAAPLAGPVAGNVVADFTDGNDELEYVDAYVGIPGDGWKTAWGANQFLTAGDTLTATNWVTAANPVAGGGNYLSSSVFTSVTAGASASYATLRDYTDGIDLALPYRIDFTIRIDEDIAATFDEYHDRYVICDGASTATGTATSNSWSILAHGAAGAAAHAGVVGKWAFYNGRNNGNYYGTNPENLLDTGVALTMGGVYDFSVTVDPIARKWSGTVSDGITSFSQSEMGWRTSASLGFANLVFGTRADVGDETRAWSIDSISIAQLSVEPPVFVDTVAARFNDGETTLEVDGYPGKAGLGWNGPWTHTASEGVTSGVALLDSSPLKPGENSGNYVQVVNSHANRSDDTPSYSGFSRDYKAPTGGVDWTKEHTIEFSIRIDEDLTAGNFNTVNDRYHASNVNNTRNTDNTASWMVYVCGGEGAYANADDVGEWVFYDGNRDSGAMDVNRTVSSDIVVVSGTVYDFTIVVDPETQSYVGSITDGVNSYTTGTLGWRRASTEIGSYLMFDTRGYLVADEFESANERMFSLDNVIITQSLARIPGDTDNDGKVDDVDAKVLATYWGSSVAVGDVTKGDFNADGVVNAIDAAILAAHWGDHNVAMESTPVGVPEPSTLLLLLAGGIAGLLTRARRA